LRNFYRGLWNGIESKRYRGVTKLQIVRKAGATKEVYFNERERQKHHMQHLC
jgi:hypothetical protein